MRLALGVFVLFMSGCLCAKSEAWTPEDIAKATADCAFWVPDADACDCVIGQLKERIPRSRMRKWEFTRSASFPVEVRHMESALRFCARDAGYIPWASAFRNGVNEGCLNSGTPTQCECLMTGMEQRISALEIVARAYRLSEDGGMVNPFDEGIPPELLTCFAVVERNAPWPESVSTKLEQQCLSQYPADFCRCYLSTIQRDTAYAEFARNALDAGVEYVARLQSIAEGCARETIELPAKKKRRR